ncbi:hypothetical protein JCM12298_20440 [Desulfothermus naphthae]
MSQLYRILQDTIIEINLKKHTTLLFLSKKFMDKKYIQNPHDAFVKEVFSHKEQAKDFLKNYLPLSSKVK